MSTARVRKPAPKEAAIQVAVIRALVARRLGIFVDLRKAWTPEAKASLLGRAAEEASRRRAAGQAVVVFWRANTGAMTIPESPGRNRRHVAYGLPGSADLTGVVYGTGSSGARFELELKRPGEHPDKHQRAFGLLVTGAGAWWGCAHSVDEACGLVATLLGRPIE